MSLPGYYNRDKLLKVGNTYTFRYVKSVVLEDGNRYMVLEDLYQMRHFLEHECYIHYNLIEASEVVCRVEKINCTGRIYLEPIHPVYKIGSEHYFNISSIFETENGLILSVYDCFNNLVNISIAENNNEVFSTDDKVFARIDSIKRGIPELTIVSSSG